MIIGIICTVILALIALWQTLSLRAAKVVCCGLLDLIAKDAIALRDQQAQMTAANRKLACIAAAAPLHRAAAARGDARQCNAIMAAAIAEAYAITVDSVE